MEAAFPGGYLVDALRLLWEIILSPEGGRKGEYQRIWVKECGFPEQFFEETLGSVPEPTCSKWQVMYETALKLLPLLSPVESGSERLLPEAERRSYLEVFLDTCRQLHCGSLDDSKETKVAHPHAHKIITLSGLFAGLNVEAGIYLIVDLGDANFKSFYKFAKSPARLMNVVSELAHDMVAVHASESADLHLPHACSFQVWWL